MSSPVPSPASPFPADRRAALRAGAPVLVAAVLAQLALAAALTWPLLPRLGAVVPGAARSDLWNSLWSLWFVAEAVGRGALPFETLWLDHPDGGVLLVADPLGALAGLVLIPLVGLEAAYGLIVLGRVALAGLAAQLCVAEVLGGRDPTVPFLARVFSPGAVLAGVGVATAPMLTASIHNGTSESVAWAPMVLACWALLRAARRPGWRSALVAALALLLATLASGYSAVIAFVFAGLLSLAPPRRPVGARLRPLLLGLALSVPVAALQQLGATHPRNLVGIKNARELALVRRTTGAADPWTFVRGFGFRSPDFAEISRYGEAFIHTAYIGHVLLAVAVAVVLRRRTRGWLLAGGLLLAALALGPVWVQGGSPVIFWDDRALPLPYLLLEALPGFGSLSLVWRLAGGLAVAAALTAGMGVARWRPGWLLVALVLAEVALVSPVADGPALTEARVHPTLVALRDAPPGAVVNFPVAGGRAYLHEQTAHHHPLAATLNVPNNSTGQRFWRKVLAELDRVCGDRPPAAVLAEARARESFLRGLGKAARALQVRYLVVHDDPDARPDMHDAAARAIQQVVPPWSPPGGSATPAPAAAEGPHARTVTVHALY